VKKLFFNLSVAFVIVIGILPLLSGGCGDNKEHNVGYYYVKIPGFIDTDYISMLDSGNAEMQYNAICYLHENVNSEPPPIDVDSLKGSRAYDSTLRIYTKIYPLMNSKNSWVSSAAIRYCKRFAYNRKAFMTDVLNNSDPSLNTQLEIINGLIYDSVKSDELQMKKFQFLLRQPSWLLQNSAYMMVNNMRNPPSDDLINEYVRSHWNYKRYLIIDALGKHITDTVFSFLAREYSITKDERTRKMIFQKLLLAQNEDMAYQWYKKHYDLVEKNMEQFIYPIFYSGNDLCSRIVLLALEKGWKPSSLLVKEDEGESAGKPVLYAYLYASKTGEDQADSNRIKSQARVKIMEDALKSKPDLKAEWLAYQEWAMENPLPAELISKHAALTEEYLRQTNLLFQQYRTDTIHASYYMQQVRSGAETLHKGKYRK
jgi:hypothetical protein